MFMTSKTGKKQKKRFYPTVKRMLDIAFSLIGFLVSIPIILAAGIIVYLDSPGPILYKQQRYGMNRRVFTIYKIRTMGLEAPIVPATDETVNPRQFLTRTGKILRRYSIDELPQFYNILKGDMSIVGPRPVILAERDLIEERERYGANSVRPGLTGWAQVNGRNDLNHVEKARLDGEYVSTYGWKMDLKILLMTVGVTASGDGVYQEKEASRGLPARIVIAKDEKMNEQGEKVV